MADNALVLASRELDSTAQILAAKLIEERQEDVTDAEREQVVTRVKYEILARNVPPGHYLANIKNRLKDAIRAEIELDPDTQEMTGVEKEALISAETIKRLIGAKLQVELAQGNAINDIESEHLAEEHPSQQYESTDDMMMDLGISKTEASRLRSLSNVIFPFIEIRMGRNPHQEYASIGPSKFNNVISLLRAAINPSLPHTSRKSVETVERIRDLILATEPKTEDVQVAVVDYILSEARMHTTNNLLMQIENAGNEEAQATDTTVLVTVRRDGESYIVSATWDLRQLEIFRGRLGPRANIVMVDNEPE